jgi:hypothetical protein
MKTSINGKPADWTPEIRAKWDAAMERIDDPRPVTDSNYFTPRPYVDQYNCGSREEGFTYIRARSVFQVIIRRHFNIGGDKENMR